MERLWDRLLTKQSSELNFSLRLKLHKIPKIHDLLDKALFDSTVKVSVRSKHVYCDVISESTVTWLILTFAGIKVFTIEVRQSNNLSAPILYRSTLSLLSLKPDILVCQF